MIFSPYSDEAAVISRIQKIRNGDYVLLRLTRTMIEKNNLDANELFREMLYDYRIVDYDLLENGGKNDVEFRCLLLLPDGADDVKPVSYTHLTLPTNSRV